MRMICLNSRVTQTFIVRSRNDHVIAFACSDSIAGHKKSHPLLRCVLSAKLRMCRIRTITYTCPHTTILQDDCRTAWHPGYVCPGKGLEEESQHFFELCVFCGSGSPFPSHDGTLVAHQAWLYGPVSPAQIDGTAQTGSLHQSQQQAPFRLRAIARDLSHHHTTTTGRENHTSSADGTDQATEAADEDLRDRPAPTLTHLTQNSAPSETPGNGADTRPQQATHFDEDREDHHRRSSSEEGRGNLDGIRHGGERSNAMSVQEGGVDSQQAPDPPSELTGTMDTTRKPAGRD